jgi:hypothetical protein
LKTVRSISSPEKIYDTNGKPVLILCDDFNFYVCKYNRWPNTTAFRLLQEYLAACFAKTWKIATPSFEFVKINPSHVEDIPGLQPAFFQAPCFGSLYSKKYAELDEFYAQISGNEKNRFKYKTELLKIALFDIWLANEDRKFNNYNLLINVEDGNRFVPIDHEAIFNTGNLNKGLALLTEEDSLITTGITKGLFSRKELLNRKYLEDIQNECYFCIQECERNSNNFLNEVPLQWHINIADIKHHLQNYLFHDHWIKECMKHFRVLLQLITKK